MDWYMWVILVAVLIIAVVAVFVALRRKARGGSVLAVSNKSGGSR